MMPTLANVKLLEVDTAHPAELLKQFRVKGFWVDKGAIDSRRYGAIKSADLTDAIDGIGRVGCGYSDRGDSSTSLRKHAKRCWYASVRRVGKFKSVAICCPTGKIKNTVRLDDIL